MLKTFKSKINYHIILKYIKKCGSEDMAKDKGMCFVIMPISDPDNYAKGHFESVYKDIFAPAINKAGYTPHRVDEDVSSGLIQAKIIENLINAPMVICDLSTRNPNVLFELGIRQAYDKPVVLVQEIGTDRIFDINGISCIDYDPSLFYRSVLDMQEKIANAIQETEKNPKYNSLVTALSIYTANYQNKDFDVGELDAMRWNSIMNQLSDIKTELGKIGLASFEGEKSRSILTRKRWLTSNEIDEMAKKDYTNRDEAMRDLQQLKDFMQACGPEGLSRGQQIMVMKSVDRLNEILRQLSN